jgi:hypothetical protein
MPRVAAGGEGYEVALAMAASAIFIAAWASVT